MKKFILTLIIISALLIVPSFAFDVYDSTAFEVSASSEMRNNSIKNAFDGEANYLWHSAYVAENGEITSQDKAPFTVDIVFPEPLFVGGIRYTPRQLNQGNSTAGIWQKGEIQGSADGINFEVIGTISSPNDIGTTRETIDFSVKSGTYKAIKITITQSMHDFCSAAEIAVIKNPVAEKLTAGEVYSSKGWKVSASSEFSPNNTIGNAFNDDTKWLWHSAYTAENGTITNQDKPPFTVDIVFPEPLAVGGIRYTPRQLSLDSSTAGIWKKAEFYGSSDGADYEKIGDMSYPNDLPQTRKVTDAFVTPGSYKAIRIVITESNADFATAAEIDVFAPGSGTFVPTVKKNVLEDKNSWSIRANSSQSGPERAIDGNINTYWHSNYKAENGVVVSTDPPPYTLDITFPEDVTISGFTYTPRQDNSSGRFTIAELWVSDTATGELIKIKDLEFSGASSASDVPFYGNIKVRKVRLNITSERGGVATVGELDFTPEDKNKNLVSYQEFIALEEENKLYEVDRTGFFAESDCAYWGGSANTILDKSLTTFWQSETGEKAPWIITVDMKSAYTLSGFTYTPRQTEDFHGVWFDFEVEVSDDKENWEFVFSDYTDKRSLEERKYLFKEKVRARYIRFIVNEGFTDRASCSDIKFLQTKEDFNQGLLDKKESYVLKIGENKINVTKGTESHIREIDVAPYIDVPSSSTLIPLRGLLEEMGAEISWDGHTQTVTVVTDSGSEIVMQIRNNLVYAEDQTYGLVRYTLRVAPEIKDGRTFIPLRFISEQLGYKVAWNGETQEITITK